MRISDLLLESNIIKMIIPYITSFNILKLNQGVSTYSKSELKKILLINFPNISDKDINDALEKCSNNNGLIKDFVSDEDGDITLVSKSKIPLKNNDNIETDKIKSMASNALKKKMGK